MSLTSIYRNVPLFSLDLIFTTATLIATLHPNILSLPFLSIQTHHDPTGKPLVFTPPLHALVATLILQRLAFALTALSVPPAVSTTPAHRKAFLLKETAFQIRAKAAAVATALALLFSVVLHVFVVLFGAPVLENAISTALLSTYVAFLAVFPAAYRLGPNPQIWARIFIEQSPLEGSSETFVHLPTTLSLIGTWSGAVVIPLDWERPWQTWPLPCIYGTFIGYFVGSILALAKISLRNSHFSSLLPGPSSPSSHTSKPRKTQKKAQ